MVTLIYFMLETEDTYRETIDEIARTFPCFISETPVEFDWVMVKITMREEDARGIARKLYKIKKKYLTNWPTL